MPAAAYGEQRLPRRRESAVWERARFGCPPLPMESRGRHVAERARCGREHGSGARRCLWRAGPQCRSFQPRQCRSTSPLPVRTSDLKGARACRVGTESGRQVRVSLLQLIGYNPVRSSYGWLDREQSLHAATESTARGRAPRGGEHRAGERAVRVPTAA